MFSLLWIFFWTMMKDGTCTAENVSFSTLPGISPNNPVIPAYMNQTEPLTVVAFGGIIFIVILITGVIILLFVVTLRFKCKTSSDTEDKAKSEDRILTESISVSTGEPGSITLISVRNLNLAKEDVEIPDRRVLITGATGLLGRAVYKEFNENNWNAFGCGYSRARPRFEQVNLLETTAVHDIIEDFQPHLIVHCAAERRPDVVESHPESAFQLNVVVSERIAKEAAKVGAFLIYISTDYVFDGTSPPYLESGIPNPLNLYGKLKLEGEKAVLQNYEGAAVLRVPILYGDVEKLEESAVTILFDKVQFSNKPANMDHWQQRFPTHVKDVASVCRQLAERRLQDSSLKGIFHWSGNEQMTKYEIACAMADAFNLPSSHLRPLADGLVVGVLRPKNAQLDCSRLENLGIGQRTPFQTGIRESLWPFLIDKKWRQTVFH